MGLIEELEVDACDGCRREESLDELYRIDWDGIESYVCGLCRSAILSGWM